MRTCLHQTIDHPPLPVLVGVLLSAAIIHGCHPPAPATVGQTQDRAGRDVTGARRPADPDDAAGLAEDLADPGLRMRAVAEIHRLYSDALAEAAGDRERPEVVAVVDATVEDLSRAYLQGRDDAAVGRAILDVLFEMRDARSLPAVVAALSSTADSDEEHVIRAAQTLRVMEVPEQERAGVVDAVGQGLLDVSGGSPVDNRMRVELVRVLGDLGDRRATPILAEVATRQSEDQSFLINRLATEQLSRLADPEAVPALILGLFLFDPENPAMRMNDVAAEALVRIGRPAYEPLLAVLRGDDEDANAIARRYIEAVRRIDAEVADAMSVEGVLSGEATFVLGALGYPEAFEALLVETRQPDDHRPMNGALALVRLNLPPAKRRRVRDVLRRVYERTPSRSKPQLVAAMRYTYDPDLIPFLLAQVGDTDLQPQVRVMAAEAVALLANAQEARRLHNAIVREPASGLRESFEEYAAASRAAAECDADLECWRRQLESDEALVVRKAAYMIGRYGRGSTDMARALTEHLDHPDLPARIAILFALDHVATAEVGHDVIDAAIRRITELQTEEGGEASWAVFGREAGPVQARLSHRL